MGGAALRPGVAAEGPAVERRPQGKSGRPLGAGVRRCRRGALRAGVGRAGPSWAAVLAPPGKVAADAGAVPGGSSGSAPSPQACRDGGVDPLSAPAPGRRRAGPVEPGRCGGRGGPGSGGWAARLLWRSGSPPWVYTCPGLAAGAGERGPRVSVPRLPLKPPRAGPCPLGCPGRRCWHSPCSAAGARGPRPSVAPSIGLGLAVCFILTSNSVEHSGGGSVRLKTLLYCNIRESSGTNDHRSFSVNFV